MAAVRAVKSGNWSDTTVWNTGALPTSADDVYSNTFTVSVDVSFTVLSLNSIAGTGITAGGSFAFNTAGVTGTITSVTPLNPGATNLIQVTATTGTVTISLGGNASTRNASSDILINYSGACNLNLSGFNFISNSSGVVSSIVCISKTSTGTLTLNGNLVGGQSNGASGNHALSSSAGNTIVNGNVSGLAGGNTGPNYGISQTAGTLVVNGNVTGGGNASGNQNGINFTGTSLTINGIVLGGNTSAGIGTSAPVNNITGNVTAGIVAAISSTSANIINVTGTVTASATANAITSTNANGQVYLNGNMVNNNGKMAIYAPIVWLDRTGTTTAAFFTSGGVARTLYSEDTVPNTPAANNVRSGITYGAGSTLRGTVVMPTAANVRNGVVYDNGTTGTALFTTSQLLTEISSSSDAVAVRIKNCATPQILGEILEAYKK